MKIVPGDGRDWTDEEVQSALQSVYAPPASEAYWEGLERRIVARIQAEAVSAREWWSYFRGWARVGVAAAVLAALIAGVAAWRTRQAQDWVTYQDVLGTPTTLPLLSETVGNEPDVSPREATLRYLLSK